MHPINETTSSTDPWFRSKEPRDQRWMFLIIVVVAVVAGLIIGGFVVNDGGDDEPRARTEIPATGDLADAEATAVRLVEAANTDDCATVEELSTERISGELVGGMNCNSPADAGIDVIDSAIVAEDPVTVSVTLADGDRRLTVELEMLRDDAGVWLANNFDAIG